MIEAINAAVATLARRIGQLEARPWNPYSPDAQFFDHFAGDGTLDARWTTTLAGTGTATIPNATPTIVRLDTGATVSSICSMTWGANFSLVGMAKAVDQRARFAVATAVDADDEVGMRLQSAAADVITIGVRGAISTAFFVARSTSGGTPTATVTAVPVDTAYHDWRIQTMPDRVRFYIDNNLVAEHTTNVPAATALAPRLVALNGANGGTRTMDVDLIWIREGR